jgi:hypothetical protein
MDAKIGKIIHLEGENRALRKELEDLKRGVSLAVLVRAKDEAQERTAALEEALRRIATETQGLRLRYKTRGKQELSPPLIADFAKEALEASKGIPLIPYETSITCLELLKPLDVEGQPNSLIALVRKAMQEIDYWKYVAAYMAECHAATAEYDGNLRSMSKSRRNRLATICKKAVRFMRREAVPTWADRQRPIEDTIERCEKAAQWIEEQVGQKPGK